VAENLAQSLRALTRFCPGQDVRDRIAGAEHRVTVTATLRRAVAVAPSDGGRRQGPRESSRRTAFRVGRVIDGDTIELASGQRIRLVQIDTPDVYFGTECYGEQASATTKRLLPLGSRVRLLPEPATDG
jgi:endonuclease YncB( thermonuclease family)